ncbi:Uncharacterised protein [Shewanella baltica]|nr:Uncharacterised protein [Shewanella baltica]
MFGLSAKLNVIDAGIQLLALSHYYLNHRKMLVWIPASITAPALFSIIAPALFYLRPSLGSYLLHLTTMEGGNVIFCMEQN